MYWVPAGILDIEKWCVELAKTATQESKLLSELPVGFSKFMQRQPLSEGAETWLS